MLLATRATLACGAPAAKSTCGRLPDVTVGTYDCSADQSHDDTNHTAGVHPLNENKTMLKDVCDDLHVPQERYVLMLAMAMQETTHMDVREHDPAKQGASGNATIFNLSKDLVEKTGYFGPTKGQYFAITDQQFNDLNAENTLTDSTIEKQQLRRAVEILKIAFDFWGVENTLAFVRGGGSAFDPCYTDSTGWSPGTPGSWKQYWAKQASDTKEKSQQKCLLWFKVMEYFGALREMLRYIDDDQTLLTSAKRPNVQCSYYG